MKQQRKAKIELIVFKNNKKTKQNLFVKPNITYESLLKKMSYLTKKQFSLEIQYKDGSLPKPFTKEMLPNLLANYKGEIINMITSTSIISNAPAELETSTLVNLEAPNQKDNQIVKILELINSHEIIESAKIPIQEKIKQLAQENVIKKLQSLHQNESVGQIKQCSQCRTPVKGIYYLCLRCPKQFILCLECQQKETYSQLKTHKFRAHPFAKIKDYKQKIKFIDIQTIQPQDIKLPDSQEQVQKEEQNSGNKIALLEQKLSEDLSHLIKMKMDSIFRSYKIQL